MTSRGAATEPATGSVLLSLTGIRRSFGAVVALDDAGLRAERGRVRALLGPNGAGKSTLISIAAGLLGADAGEVEVNARVGLMPQEHALYPVLTARENLEFVGRALGLRRRELAAEVDRVLETVRLRDRADERTAGFSGGMKRRLGFAAATLGEPDLLLLDEPTVGVDPQSRLALLDMVEAEAARGAGIVYSTHYMEEAQRIAEEVTILYQGRVLVEGTVAEVVATQGTVLLEVEISGGDQAEFQKAMGKTFGGPEVLRADGEALRLRVPVADRMGALEKVVGAASANSSVINDLRLVEPSLESAFIALTGKELTG